MSNASKRPASMPEDGPNQAFSYAGCLVQLMSSFAGFALVLILWILILRDRPWTLTSKDAIYWTAVLGMIAARYVHVARFGGHTMDGVPATPRDVGRYGAVVLLASAAAWGIAQSFEV